MSPNGTQALSEQQPRLCTSTVSTQRLPSSVCLSRRAKAFMGHEDSPMVPPGATPHTGILKAAPPATKSLVVLLLQLSLPTFSHSLTSGTAGLQSGTSIH